MAAYAHQPAGRAGKRAPAKQKVRGAKAAGPKTAKPKTAKPKTAASRTAKPKAAAPKVAGPDAARISSTRPSPGKPRTRKPSRGARPASDPLERLTADEAASILRELLSRHPSLRSEARTMAADILARGSVDDTAEEVCGAVVELDLDDLGARAGRHSWGYVEPTEAAWELLEETVGKYIEDMKRRAAAGQQAAAETFCLGIVIGLHAAEAEARDGNVLDYAPDFLADEAAHAVQELLRASPPGERAGARDRLMAVLTGEVGPWAEMLGRIRVTSRR